MTAWIRKNKVVFYSALLLLLGGVFYWVALKIVNPVEYANSDFFTFWLSGRLVWQQKNLYDSFTWVFTRFLYQSSWIPDLIFIYPLPMALFFVPFGLLPVYPAFLAWDVLTQFMILAALLILLRVESDPMDKRLIFPLAAGILFFRATIVTLTNGQVSGLLLLLLAGIISLWAGGKWERGAALLALFALKPNLGGPLIGLLSLYLLRRKKFKALLVEALVGLLLWAVGWIMSPNWVMDFWNAGSTKLSQTFGLSPTIWGVAEHFCGSEQGCTMGIGLGVCAVFLSVYLLMLIKMELSAVEAAEISAALMLLLTPYTWPYDQLLLVAPIVMLTTRIAGKCGHFLSGAVLFLLIDLVTLLLLAISGQYQREFWNAGVPFLVFVLLAGYVWRGKSTAGGSVRLS